MTDRKTCEEEQAETPPETAGRPVIVWTIGEQHVTQPLEEVAEQMLTQMVIAISHEDPGVREIGFRLKKLLAGELASHAGPLIQRAQALVKANAARIEKAERTKAAVLRGERPVGKRQQQRIRAKSKK